MKRALALLFAALVGLLLSGAVMALVVPSDPARYGPGTAILVTIACVAVLVGVAAFATRRRAPTSEPE